MKISKILFAALLGCAMLASISHAQVRQSTLYIDNGSGTFLELVASSLTGATNRTIYFGNPTADGDVVLTQHSATAANGDILYYNSTTGEWTRLAAAVGVLQAGTTPSYGKVDLANSSYVTGILPVANGGTGSSTSTGAAAAILPAFVNGDVLGVNGVGSLAWTAPGSLAPSVTANQFYVTNNALATAWVSLNIGSGLTGDGITTPLNVNLTGSNTWSGAETFAPTGSGVTGLTVEGTSGGGTADIFDVTGTGGTPHYLSVSSAGAVTIPTLTANSLTTIDGTSGFTIQNHTTPANEAQFVVSGTGTQTYTFPTASGTIALVGNSNPNPSTNFASLGINIGAATPNTNLDVNGDVAVRADTNATAGTTLDNLSTSGRSNIDFTSANQTGNFTIDGFANGEPGKQLHIYNNSGHNMTIKYLDGSETAGNEINTLAGGDVTLNGNGTVNFVYDGAAGSGSWVMQPAMANTITGLAAVGITFTVEPSAVASSTTDPTADAYLQVPVTAGATYEVRGILQVGYTADNNEIWVGFNPSAGSLSSVAISLLQFTPVSGNTAIGGAGFITAGGTP